MDWSLCIQGVPSVCGTVYIKLKVPPRYILLILGGAATCSEGFVNCFLRVPQAVRLYYSCHTTQARGNFKILHLTKPLEHVDAPPSSKAQLLFQCQQKIVLNQMDHSV